MTGALYCTEQDVRGALDVRTTAYASIQILRAIEASSRAVEGPAYLNRIFYPEILTRTYDWPEWRGPRPAPWRLYLGDRDLISLTSISASGTAITPASALLRPVGGPPYTEIQLDQSTSAAFRSGDTWQGAISITGLWGHSDSRESAGTVVTTVNASVTTLDVTANTAIGTGSVLVIGTERLAVTAMGWLTTAQTGSLTASQSAVTLAVADGTAFIAGEALLIDSEALLITGVSGNNLTIQRAYDGSVLAAHTTATIYAQRRLTVTRGAFGSTAASHLAAAAIETWAIPPLLRSLTAAESIVTFEQGRAGYARTVGSAESERESSGRGLADLRKQAMKSALRRRIPYGGAV